MWEALVSPALPPISLFSVTQLLAAFSLAATRLVIILTFMPVFTELALPVSIRFSAALALSAPLLPTLDVFAVDSGVLILPWEWFLLILKEAAIGLVLMLVFGLPFWAVQFAGDIIELQRGMGNEPVTDPNNLVEAQPTGRLLFLIFLLFVLANDGLLIIMDLLYRSFLVFPVMAMPDLRELLQKMIDMGVFESIFEYGLLILMPALLLLVLVDTAIALMTRFAQQMNVLQLILVIRGLVVIAALPFYGPGLFRLVEPLLEDMAARIWELAP